MLHREVPRRRHVPGAHRAQRASRIMGRHVISPLAFCEQFKSASKPGGSLICRTAVMTALQDKRAPILLNLTAPNLAGCVRVRRGVER